MRWKTYRAPSTSFKTWSSTRRRARAFADPARSRWRVSDPARRDRSPCCSQHLPGHGGQARSRPGRRDRCSLRSRPVSSRPTISDLSWSRRAIGVGVRKHAALLVTRSWRTARPQMRGSLPLYFDTRLTLQLKDRRGCGLRTRCVFSFPDQKNCAWSSAPRSCSQKGGLKWMVLDYSEKGVGGEISRMILSLRPPARGALRHSKADGLCRFQVDRKPFSCNNNDRSSASLHSRKA